MLIINPLLNIFVLILWSLSASYCDYCAPSYCPSSETEDWVAEVFAKVDLEIYISSIVKLRYFLIEVQTCRVVLAELITQISNNIDGERRHIMHLET